MFLKLKFGCRLRIVGVTELYLQSAPFRLDLEVRDSPYQACDGAYRRKKGPQTETDPPRLRSNPGNQVIHLPFY